MCTEGEHKRQYRHSKRQPRPTDLTCRRGPTADRRQPTAVGHFCFYNVVVQPAIRLATPADLDALLQLERQAPTAAHWSGAQYQVMFQTEAPSRLCLVAETSVVLAFLVARTTGPEWEVENIVVAPDARRRGIGTQLLGALLDRAREHGAQAVWLEVRASNAAARSFYRGLGFMAAGVRPRYYHEPQEDAITFVHTLE